MLGYSDTNFSSSLCPPSSPPKVPSPLVDQHREKRGNAIQLTPLWEHVVRNQTVPKDVNLDDVFIALNDRLRDPEWEVRQHALRVLVDVIPVMDETLDQRMEILLGDLVGNLGHPGPAVRKGALDSLKVYLTHSAHADEILRNIVYRGVEHYTDNQLQSDVVVGIILSLPSLIFPGRTSENTIEYIIKTLITKLVQVTFQEVSLRSLARIRDVISPKEFDRILEDTQPNTRRDFELLCQVYEAHSQKNMFTHHELSSDEDKPKWNDLNANIIHDNRWNSDSDSAGVFSPDEFSKPIESQKDLENNLPSGKVILETEIQFNSSTAVTMKILEQREKSINDSDSDEDSRDCVVKVLSDSDNDEEFELRRRTPRRVRFGGEIVKLRTPDSDSNHPSDTDNDITITTTSNEDADNPVIEIKFITNGKERKSHQSRSLIPVPVIPVTQKPKARSLPTSPSRKLDNQVKSRQLFQSHPNLTRAHFFPKQKLQKLRPPKRLKVEIPKKPTNYVDTAISPVYNHKEVELFHNLSRSPVHVAEAPFTTTEEVLKDLPKLIEQPIKVERKISTADSILLESKQIVKEERSIVTADMKKPRSVEVRKMPAIHKDSSTNAETSFTTDMSDDSNRSRTFSSFILKDPGSDGIQSDCYIPNLDTGDCLTCSSSGSEGVQIENNWETSGLIDKGIIEDMHDKDDWRVRLRGFESFKEALLSPEIHNGLAPHLGAIFHFLFNAERQPKLQSTIEITLKNLISNSTTENLKSNLSQLAISLSKMGAPSGIRLAIALMQQVSAKTFVQYVLEDPIMSSRSAKTREGALQIILCATTMFPSTEFDSNLIANKVALVATDRKRRIRQATLDVLAVLGQIGRPGDILEAVELASKDLPGKDGLIAAVRTRLSRRQHPIVEADGNVIYASPAVGNGADVEWVAAGSGSISPVSARSRRRALDTITRVDSSAERSRAESAALPQRNMWSARRYEDPAEPFGENVTWALVPVNNNNNKIKEESQNKTYPGTQLWAIEQANTNGDIRLNGSSGSLRPVYLLQAQQPPPNNHIRLRQVVQNGSSSERGSAEKSNQVYSRGRSSSPPVRLVQIKGATRATRGQSSSPPEYGGRTIPDLNVRRRIFPASISSGSGSSQSRGSPPRNNWQREFQSAIPVPVSGEGRSRFRTRYRDPLPSQQQPMTAFGHHGPSVGSAPVHVYGRTKSPSPTRFSVDKFSISQDSGINQHTSSGSESSDYYTPPAEPYLPIQSTEPSATIQNIRDDSFDQSDRSDTPPIPQQPQSQQRERFINLEDSPSGSDFEEADTKKQSDESQDDVDNIRSQKFQKLQEEHVITSVITKEPFREKVTEKRLSKSHHDLSELKNSNRKTINSAPAVKHLKALDNSILIENNLNNNVVDEESKSSQSTIELKSVNQSLLSLNQSQNSLNSQVELSLNQSQPELRTPSYQSQADVRSLNQSHGDLRSLNQSQGDLRLLNQSQGDLQSLNSQTDLNLEPKTEVVKYPEIVRKPPKIKPELKRRASNLPKKVPEVFPDSLRNFPKPREGFNEMISQLESPEWEMSVKGLQALVRLIRHHQDTVEAQMHTVCVLLGRHIKNLRSQVARAACLAATEMFVTHKKALEPELEEIAVPLLHRTADTNKFLRGDANAALDAMCLNMSTPRVVSVLSTRGATHHNAVVRCSTARLITDLVKRLGPQRVFQLPKDTRDRILVIGATMLMEGSLETRKHAKNMFAELSSHGQFQRAVYEAVPTTTMRHISKTINSFK